MMTRNRVLADAVNKCMRELYSLAQPSINFDDFVKENAEFLKKEQEYYALPEKGRSPYTEYVGPKPYEFYYLPETVIRNVIDSYVDAYRLNGKQELLDTIKVLKDYCVNPIVDKYIEREDDKPGYRDYEHPDNLEKELRKIIKSMENVPLNKKESYEESYNKLIEDVQNKFFEFLDMAGKFYNWNGDLNAFYTNTYLGASPSSNKEAVINNWKKYRNIDIEIDESKYDECDE